jgi:hypothetical protein
MSNSLLTTIFESAKQLPDIFPQCPHGTGIDAVTGPRAVDRSGDQACFFKHLQVLRNRGLGQWHDIDNLTAQTGTAASECLQNGQPGRVRQRLASRRQGLKPG